VRQYTSSSLKSDINITRNGEVKFATGVGGRSSKTGYTATIFGATGFIGRYLNTRLAKKGTITVAPWRDDMKKRLLKVSGDLGVVNFVEFDLRNVESINEAVKYSDIVYNLVGADANTKNFSMADVNIESARRIAQAASDHGVPRLVHVSSYNADPNSSSIFYATKGIGEQTVRDIYPDVTIVRPSIVYGAEDKFLNELGDNLRFLTVNHMQEKIFPVHVIDVVTALERIGFDDSTAGQTYELVGPELFTLREVRDLIEPVTKIRYTNLNVPKNVALKWTEFLQKLWWPMHNPDQIERQFIDQYVDPKALTFNDLGIIPGRLQDHVFEYTRKFRNSFHAQDLPPTSEQLEHKA
jgi:NADH dehydrogenase (ubiquinone) 1 alpha subcomplex subunit 9